MLESEYITQNSIIKLKKWEYFWHFSPAIVLLGLPIIDLYYILESYFTNNEIVFERLTNSLGIVWVFLSISIIIIIFKYNNLKFKTLDIQIKAEQFREAIELTKNELKWLIIKQDENILIAHSKKSMFSWGEQITIIKEGNKIYINSICTPGNTSLFGNNKKNIETFERNLKANVQQRV